MTPASLRARLVPSILSADLSRLGEQLAAVRDAGVDWVSVDVMDGHFVPNLSFGPDFVRLCKERGFFFDAHLMVSNPDEVCGAFAKAGADIVTAHLEACPDARATLERIRRAGAKPGLAIKPATPAEGLLPWLDGIELALVMTVEPGFGGQRFMPGMLPKIETLRRERDRRGLGFWIQADGGLNEETISLAARAGADSIVAGSAVFSAADPAAAARRLLARIS
ncbi:MAG: ribulose-phosphate 3-epimerase [Elusimicrobia bacterium]|nr:ribulose-phosphate 3-epimerase [Elusimicrobiota bacterium]